jgi:hypothetical protein
MKNYDQTTRRKTFCVRHNKYCKPASGSWTLRENGWECLDAVIPYPEFVTQKTRDERVKYANDQLQSHRGGDLSREFLEAHPKRAREMLKGGAITKEDIKNSKYVWKKDVKGVTKKIDAEELIK